MFFIILCLTLTDNVLAISVRMLELSCFVGVWISLISKISSRVWVGGVIKWELFGELSLADDLWV